MLPIELPSYDAEVITSSKNMADFFEESLKYTKDAKSVFNWMMGDLLVAIFTPKSDRQSNC
jgi:Asp-tRNA(Asn)/Glu-tRNA(Gln) amidotransferase B subunit